MTVFKGAQAVQRSGAKGERRAWTHAASCLALLWALLWAPPAMTAETAPLLEMDLPAQNLEQALQAFSQATGMAVLVDRELTRGRRSIGVHGRYTAQQALGVLLTGSGLMARYASSDAFTLQVPEVSRQVQPHGVKGRAAAARINNSYAAALQKAIERSLCASPLTRPGTFRALVQVWVNREGLIEHSRLVSTTGDVQRDEALVRSLGATRVNRPAPSSLRSPVTLLLMPETAGTRMECTAGKGASGS